MKTEEQVYEEILTYINGKNHKRPITLSTIKKDLRTEKIVDLVFSRPDIFNLEKELLHVPEGNLSEKSLLTYILWNPKNFESLSEENQTLPTMIAFEIAKRRYERQSAIAWGRWAEKIEYTGNLLKYKNDISDICDRLNIKFEDTFFDNFGNIIDTIQNFCKEFKGELTEEEKYIPKYFNVELNSDKKVFILISGWPDAGKTTFQSKLAYRIPDSYCFDSDIMFEKNILGLPLKNIIPENCKVVIFSDIYAYKFFNKKELQDFIMINIIIKPSSVEKMYRNSKSLQHIDFEIYKKIEINNISFDDVENPIMVTNNYDNSIYKEVDDVIEEICKRIDSELPMAVDDKWIDEIINPTAYSK